MKVCVQCGVSHTNDHFTKDQRTKDKLSARCLSCQGIAVDGHKACVMCGVLKPLEDFHKDIQSPDLHRKICKVCGSKSAVRWNKDDPETFAKYAPQWKRAHRDSARTSQRKAHLQKTYGITQEQYWEMFELQGRVCAICHTAPKTRNLHVDHDHKTGSVRGLLCSACNSRLLPILEHHPERVTATFEYLANPPFKRLSDITNLPESFG